MVPIQDGGPLWGILLMFSRLALAVTGIVPLTRCFTRPVDTSTLGVARLAESNDTRFDNSQADTQRDTFVVIPDISGYARFIQLIRFAAGHAQVVVAQLLDAVMTAAQPPLLPTRVEGDSVMFCAFSPRADPATGTRGPKVAAAAHDRVTASQGKRAELLAGNLFPWEACKRMNELELNLVAHRVDIVPYRLRGAEVLSGTAVVEAPRLLNNSFGRDRYVLLSEAAAGDIRPPRERAPGPHREAYDGIGEVCRHPYPLEQEAGAESEVPKSPIRDIAAKLASKLQTLAGSARLSGKSKSMY